MRARLASQQGPKHFANRGIIMQNASNKSNQNRQAIAINTT